MPKYGKEQERYYMERIRAVIAFNPNMANTAIRKALQDDWQNPITLDRFYIAKLRGKIQKQRKYTISVTAVENRIAQMQDTAAAVVQKMVDILLDPSTAPKDRVAAGKLILEADRALFQAEMDAGIFERNLGSLALKHKLVIDPARTQQIALALKNLGLIKQNTIDVQSTPTPSLTGDSPAGGK